MALHKIVTVSGPDRVGKETQSNLLQRVLHPSVRMAFPNYDHWSGKIIRALLYGDAFSVTTIDGTFEYSEQRQPLSFQYLQEINRLEQQNLIRKTLETHNIIMDRYDVDSIVYGLADGCDLKILLEFDSQRLSSDAVIILTGTSLFRNEKEDQYETDTSLQTRARNNFQALAYMNPSRYACVNVDDFAAKSSQEEDILFSVFRIHVEICKKLSSLLGTSIRPVDYAEVTRKI